MHIDLAERKRVIEIAGSGLGAGAALRFDQEPFAIRPNRDQVDTFLVSRQLAFDAVVLGFEVGGERGNDVVFVEDTASGTVQPRAARR